MEEMLLLETGNDLDEAGKPKNKRYLEKDLPVGRADNKGAGRLPA